jgi:hypothetical protein
MSARARIAIAAAFLAGAGTAAAADSCPATYPHPARAALVHASLVQAFISCSLYGGHGPNSTTEGLPSCFPGETFHQQANSPTHGWLWGPHARGSVVLKSTKNTLVGPLNVDPEAVDMSIEIRMSKLLDDEGLVDGRTGHAQLVVRMTFPDRAHDQVMTVVDYPIGFAVTANGGKISRKTSLTALLNGNMQPALPRCATIELILFVVNDPNGSPFARLGSYLP